MKKFCTSSKGFRWSGDNVPILQSVTINTGAYFFTVVTRVCAMYFFINAKSKHVDSALILDWWHSVGMA